MTAILALTEQAARPWRFEAKPQVWLLVAGIITIGVYASRVIGPKALERGAAVVTVKQRWSFIGGVALLWLVSDWPMHDIGEDYLYSVHMIQHLLMSYVVAPLLLLATPAWLAELLVGGQGQIARGLLWLTKPIPAGVIFNGVTILLHWPAVVRLSVLSGPAHYSMHLLLFAASLLMWMPVCGPLARRRLAPPVKMLYLFLQTIVPTVPAGWLAMAEGTVYRVYDRQPRLWGISVASDQQAAGAIMKVIGGLYLWTVIAVIFFRWAADEERRNRRPPVIHSSNTSFVGREGGEQRDDRRVVGPVTNDDH